MASRREFLTVAAAYAAGASSVGVADAASPSVVSVLNGQGAPGPALGIVGDFYIDDVAHAIYGPKRTYGWGSAVSLIGPAGAIGPAGQAGPAGYSMLHGSGPPAASLGADNDFYIDTLTTQLYGPKAGGVWGSPVSLTGEIPTDVAIVTTQLPPSNGHDDTSALNQALASGGHIKGHPGTYVASAPLVIPSNTILDMSMCHVALKSGSLCNVLINQAVNGTTRVTDAVMASTGSSVLSSASAPFASGMVGQPVTVQGAGTGGTPLSSSVASYQSADQITLADGAATAVSGQYAAIGPRDSNITVIAGLWDHGPNFDGGTVHDHTMRFRHVDGLRVIRPDFPNDSGKYKVNAGDCTRIAVELPGFAAVGSDGVHFNGPIQDATVLFGGAGTMEDDLMSLTAADSTPQITDCAGDITDVDIFASRFEGASYSASALKLVAGQTSDGSADYLVARIRAYGLTGPTRYSSVVFIGDSSGGYFDDITLDGITSLGGGHRAVVTLNGGPTFGVIRLRNVTPAGGDGVVVAVGSAGERLEVDGIGSQGRTDSNLIQIYAGGSIMTLIGRNLGGIGTTAEQCPLYIAAGASISRCVLDGIDWTASGAGDGSAIVFCRPGGTLGTLELNNVHATNVDYPIGYFGGHTLLIPGSVCATGMTAWTYSVSGAPLTLISSSGLVGDSDTIAEDVAGSTTIRPFATTTGAPGSVEPSDLGLAAWNYDPFQTTGSATPAASGQVLLARMRLTKSEVGTVVYYVPAGGAGSGAVAGQCFAGLYDSAGNLLAQTADIGSDIANTGLRSQPLSAPLTGRRPGETVWVAVLWNAAQLPALQSGSPTGTAIVQAFGSAGGRYGTVDSQSSLPPTVRVPANAGSSSVWLALL